MNACKERQHQTIANMYSNVNIVVLLILSDQCLKVCSLLQHYMDKNHLNSSIKFGKLLFINIF